jgi:UDP-N-acetylmuramoyl-tripeptide--D-alanyl-D-alanine ligase
MGESKNKSELRLAKLGRSRSRATFVCITGSSAKSSTTEMISHILAGLAPVRSQVLKNCFADCVETLRHIEPAHRYVVCELASEGPGRLQPMIDLLRPSVGVVTLVALEHYSAFRTLEAVAAEKGKLIEGLPKHGLAVLNRDDPHVRLMAARTRARVVTFGWSDGEYRITQTRASEPGKLSVNIAHEGETFELQTRLAGSLSVAAAFTCSHQLGAPASLVKERLEGFQPIFGRCSAHFVENGPVFIADTVKAPYHSIYLPINMMTEFSAPRRRIVIGQLSDLTNSIRKYRDVYRAARLVADQVIFVGDHSHRSKATAEDIAAGRFVEKRRVEEAAAFVKATAMPGEIILLKSSRNLHLERILLSFEHQVRCWQQACGVDADCVRCGSYALPFAQQREIKKQRSEINKERKKQRRLKPSRWEGMLVRWLPALERGAADAADDATRAPIRIGTETDSPSEFSPVKASTLVRSRSRATFVCITGSSAKSSTTAILSHILAGLAPVYSQVPDNTLEDCVKTLRHIEPAHAYVVCELGSGGPGTLEPKIDLLRPSVGVVTLVALEHHSAFRSLEAVAEEKRKLVEGLPRNGLAVLNHDDPRVRSMASRTQARVVSFGKSGGDYLITKTQACMPGELSVTIAHDGATFELNTRLTGSHNSLPVAAAFACAHQLGAPASLIKERVGNFQPIFGRCSTHIVENGPTFVADTFKAPFHSIYLPINMMAEFRAPRRRIVIGQLSDYSGKPKTVYRDVYRACRQVVDQVIFVGDHSHRSGATAKDIAAGRFVEKRSVEEAAAFVKATAIPGEIILLKTSGNLHLERILLGFEHQVRCWEQTCGKRKNCGRCGSYTTSFAQQIEIKKERKTRGRLKPSPWKGMLIRWIPGIQRRTRNSKSSS